MITRTFDLRSRQLDAQLAALQSEVQAMEKRVAPAVLITRARREGNFLHVTLLAAVKASSARPTDNSVQAWSAY